MLKDYKDHKESLDVGDDTIESLQDIIDGQPGELKTEDEDDAAYEKEILKKLELASAGDKETVDLDRLNDKLKSLADNIQKVKTGLDGLEVQVGQLAIETGSDGLSDLERLVHHIFAKVLYVCVGGCGCCMQGLRESTWE